MPAHVTRRSALLATAFSVIGAQRAAAQTSSQPATVRIGSAPNDDITPALYALHNDLFRSAGLDVQLSGLSSGSAISAAVAGGALDIGRSSLLPLITARSRGILFDLLVPSGLYSSDAPISALIVPTASPVKTARDLAGKIVSVPALGDLDNIGVKAWIDANGGDATQTQYVEMPGSSVMNEVIAGRVAAGTLQNPFLSQALKSGSARVLAYHVSAIGSRLLQSSWFVMDAYLEKNAGVCRAFAQVMQQASAYSNTHHPETAALLAEYTKVDPAVVATMTRVTFASSFDVAQIQPLINAAAKYRVIQQPFDARTFIARRPVALADGLRPSLG